MARKAAIKKQKICIIGAGHVGLVSAACFADIGHAVICTDSDKKKIERLKKGIMPFYEPDLEKLVKDSVKKRHLRFSHNLPEAIRASRVIFMAVGTPPNPDGSADLTAIENVAVKCAKNLNSYKLIVEKSTVPVQTGLKVKETILRYRKRNQDFDVASNPEFLREGKAVYDSFYPSRIVLGVESKKAENILRDIYAPFKCHIVVTDINTAELIKHASNSFLAMKISFINAVARICDLAKADVKKVSLAMGFDGRIGSEFLEAGVGYGGACFPKDLEAFYYISKKLGYNCSFLKEVIKINQDQKKYFVEKIRERLWVLKDKKIAVLGLSFKPDTDDMRLAPSIDIVGALHAGGAHVYLYDPQAMEEAKTIFKEGEKITFCQSPYEAVKNCDCLTFLTEWNEFEKLNFKRIKNSMHYPLIADGRNMFDRDKLAQLGFEYIGIGR